MFLVQSSDKMFLCQSEVQKMTTTNGLEPRLWCNNACAHLKCSRSCVRTAIESNETQRNWYLLLLLITQHSEEIAKTGWLWIRIMCPSGATYGLLFQSATKLPCSCHDIAEKLLICCETTITHSPNGINMTLWENIERPFSLKLTDWHL
jgi:hypothetical protein